MAKFLLSLLLIITFQFAQAQLTQTIRGKIVDKESKSPLVGVAVSVFKDSVLIAGTACDTNGNFRINNVPVERVKLKVTLIGYEQVVIPNIVISSAKEMILTIEMEEVAVSMNAVVITATDKNQTVNEMTTVSARAFNVDEANRYAGSRGEPSRMASNFAGVQGSNDSRNDIVVRGNSPLGVLWRLEGIDIPNPNHFAVAGTTGGPVSMLNNKVLANSDFMTGAFPAEYGNSTAGVFDLRFRNGNNEKHEFTGQFGFLGTELSAEGPLNKGSGSSYLISYRYSTLKLFESLNIKIGTDAVPSYQDASFKLSFPLKNNAIISVFGLGGASKIDIMPSETKKEDDTKEIYGKNDRDQHFGTSMGLIGASFSKTINTSTYTKLVICNSLNENHTQHNLIYRNTLDYYKVDSLVTILQYQFKENRTSAHWFINKKINTRLTLKSGILASMYTENLHDSTLNYTTYNFVTNFNYNGSFFVVQPYSQIKYRVGANLIFNAGIHGYIATINKNSNSIEPRLGVKWNFSEKQTLSFAYGLHSQLMPTYVYFFQKPDSNNNYTIHNKNIGLSRSHHFVLGHDWSLGHFFRLKTEIYYQRLFNVPIEKKPTSFSLVNQGSGFSRFFPDSLENKGVGNNYGLEFTLEKFFSKNYFFMLTLSLYDSKYKGSDGVWRNSDFNGNYATNLLAGKEFKIGDKKTIGLGGKTTYAGGKRYGPVDLTLTKATGDYTQLDSERNSKQFKPYFRFDAKLYYRINTKRLTHEFAFDIVNVFNTENALGLTYSPNPGNPSANPIKLETQLGRLPLFYYKIDF